MLLDTIADVIPLTNGEKTRFAELEGIVQTHLETFLTVGRALAEIRNKRLYRELYGTWEDYCTRKWGFGYNRANELVRCSEIAEGLLTGCAGPHGDAPLPADLSPDTLRPLQRLDAPLQSAVWRLASKMGKPTAHVVAKVVRVVETAICQGSNGASEPKPKPPVSEKKVFLASLHRLADGRWFSPHLVVAGLDEAKARRHLAACQNLIGRCHEIIEQIRQEFPTL